MTDKQTASLFEGIKPEILTESVKKKIATLIEATVSERVQKQVEQLDEKFEEYKKLEAARMEKKAVKYLDETIVRRLNGWLDLVANEYVNENKLAVENGLAKKLHESLVASLQETLADHKIPVAEKSKIDEIVKVVEQLKADKAKLLERSVQYKEHATCAKANMIFEKVSAELSLSQKERLKKLAGSLDIDDLKDFKERLITIKESLVAQRSESQSSRKPLTERSTRIEDEEANEGADTKSPFKMRPEGSPNGAFANIPDMQDLL